jgi:hypothetical protein
MLRSKIIHQVVFRVAAPAGCIITRMPTRRFPPPWDIEEANAACYISG